MKHKKNIFTLVCSVVIVIGGIVVWQRYQTVQPIEVSTPIISYDTRPATSDGEQTTSSNTSVPADAKPTINATRVAQAKPQVERSSDIVINSPKQTEIKQSVTKEEVYYPLLTANDPGYASNWALQKVNAPTAWDIATGNGQTVVAVIDTGFALNHQDLNDNWFQNTNEQGTTSLGGNCWSGTPQDKRTNNCDDDNNGYIDDWRGWNFSLGDNNPMTGRENTNGVAVAHGTEVAGLVGATGNNGTGIATINWNTKIMPLQALSDDGPGYTSDVVAAIYYAVDNGADVINMSLGGNTYDPALKSATDYAYNNNVVIVAAAGNCGSGAESGCQTLPAGSMGYPALNDHVIAVGATTSSDQRASFSSYGPGLDVVAPGSGSIVSPTWTAGNGTSLYAGALYGTSFSSPQVASLASLIKSIRPDSNTDDIKALIMGTATKLSAMNGGYYTNELGHGIINAEAALTVASSLNTAASLPSLLQAGGPVSEHRFASTDTLGSGCKTAIGRYCAVWLRSNGTGYERYLPYQLSNQQGLTGWSWSGASLTTDEWQTRAVQGTFSSSIYTLSNK